MPTYIKVGNIRSDGPGWLGALPGPEPERQGPAEYEPFRRQPTLRHAPYLLNDLDSINRQVDRSGQMEGLDGFEQQAFDLVLGSAKDAFDVKKEDPKVASATAKASANSCCWPSGSARRSRVCERQLRRLGYARGIVKGLRAGRSSSIRACPH